MVTKWLMRNRLEAMEADYRRKLADLDATIQRTQKVAEEMDKRLPRCLTIQSFDNSDPQYLLELFKIQNNPQFRYFMTRVKQGVHEKIELGEPQAATILQGMIKGLWLFENTLEEMATIYQKMTASHEQE